MGSSVSVESRLCFWGVLLWQCHFAEVGFHCNYQEHFSQVYIVITECFPFCLWDTAIHFQ